MNTDAMMELDIELEQEQEQQQQDFSEPPSVEYWNWEMAERLRRHVRAEVKARSRRLRVLKDSDSSPPREIADCESQIRKHEHMLASINSSTEPRTS
jgi:hypothetical protein